MKLSIKINELLFIKILAILLVLYMNIIGMYVLINRALLMIGAPLALLVFVYAIRKNISLNTLLPLEMRLYLLFFFFALTTGMIVAINKQVLLKGLMTYLQTLIFMVCLIIIVSHDRSLLFLEVLIILTAFAMAIVVLNSVSSIQDALGARQAMYRGSISKVNPNDVGLTQNAAFFIQIVWIRRLSGFSHQFKKNSIKYSIILGLLALIGITLLTILVSGSRKSLLASLVVLVLGIVLFPKKGGLTRLFSILGMGLLIIGTAWIGEQLIDDFYIFSRFQNFFTESSNTSRVNMIQEGFKLVGKSPFMGIGFANYTYVASFNTYSHNTIAEALATTGVVGTTIYLLTYVTIGLKLLKLRNQKESYEFATNGLVLLGTLVFISIGVIHFYEILSALLFTYLIAGISLYQMLDKKRASKK
jgi:O-antigen ligase